MKRFIKKTKTFITNRTIIGAVLLASALWFYSSMNEFHQSKITLPVTVKLPDDRAIVGLSQKNVTLEIKGNGWNLFNATVLNKTKNCIVDLTDVPITNDMYIISRSEIVKGIKDLDDVEKIDVMPEHLSLTTGTVAEKKVPLRSNLNIIPQKGYTQVGAIKLSPDSVTIRGYTKLVEKINTWYTSNTTISDIFVPHSGVVNVSDSLANTIEVKENLISYSVDIQQIADMTIYDVPIKIHGGNTDRNLVIRPSLIDISITGGINVIDRLNRDSIKVELDYSDILNNPYGIIVPKIVLPSNVRLLNASPSYIYFSKVRRVNNLSGL